MAVFYFSTGGGSWNECNAPSNFSDPITIDQANASCSLIADGRDLFNLPTVLGSDAWLSPSNECFWGGLACINDTLCMDRIEFENNTLSGTLPVELGNLTGLRYLLVEEGFTNGAIPSEYGLLSDLIILDLNFNNLTGSIPESIYGLTKLFQLDLNDNSLNGTISQSIDNLIFLQLLQLQANQFTGTIPESMGQLDILGVLELFSNQLEGSMPPSVCQQRGINRFNLTTLTADCNPNDVHFVNCSVPDCCTACPF